jgi:hypothetical protein
VAESKTLSEGVPLDVSDTLSAPFIYFEEAPTLGYINGLVRITLSAERTTVHEGKLKPEQVAVAFLRTNVQGARALVAALNDALLASQPVSDGKPN